MASSYVKYHVGPITVLVFEFKDEADSYVAQSVIDHVRSSKKPVLGLPTGKTPLGMYKKLVDSKVSFENAVTFNLDELYPIDEFNPNSYCAYMWKNFPVKAQHRYIPLGTGDAKITCQNYDKEIKNHDGDKLYLLGIGTNGHIGFNEPGDCSAGDGTRLVNLSEETKRAIARDFVGEKVPEQGITMGFDHFLTADNLILMAYGKHKTQALFDTLWNNNTPASLLFKAKGNVTFVLDKEAAEGLSLVRSSTNLTDPHQRIYETITPGTFALSAKKPVALVISPHPDDDVIGMGGTMKKLVDAGFDVFVAYLTSGRGGVTDSYVDHFSTYYRTMFDGSPTIVDSRQGHKGPTAHKKAIIRRIEAVFALSVLGINRERALFDYTLDVGANRTKNYLENNLCTLNKLFENIRPDVVFVCGDDDPNGRHRECRWQIRKYLAETENRPTVYEYSVAWGQIELNAADVIIPLDRQLLDFKKKSILEHKSQNPPVVTDGSDTPFHKRAMNVAKKYAKQLNLGGYCGAECFAKWHFPERYI